MTEPDARHEPALYTAGHHGAWARCSCGWTSTTQRNIRDASFAWAMHLLAEQRRNGDTP